MAKRLLILNGLATLGVVLHHAAAYGLQAMFQWTDRYQPVTVPNYDQLGSLAFEVTLFIRMLTFIAVPGFFFVSGFFTAFMARGSGTQLKWHTMIPRLKILAVPFILWTMIRYALIGQVPTSLNHLLDPYFFIPVIAQFYLLAPIIVRLAQTRWKLLLAMAALLQLVLVAAGYVRILGLNVPVLEPVMDIPRWLFLAWPFWFPFGVITGLHLQTISKPLQPIKWGLLVALLALPVLSVIEYHALARLTNQDWLGPTFGGLPRTLYALAAICCFIAFDKIYDPRSQLFAQLAPKSLGIYVANIPAIYVVAVMMYYLTPRLLGNQLIYQSILFVAGLGGPLLLMEIVQRSRVRWAYRYMFG